MTQYYKNKHSGDFTTIIKPVTNLGWYYETAQGKTLPQWYVENNSDWVEVKGDWTKNVSKLNIDKAMVEMENHSKEGIILNKDQKKLLRLMNNGYTLGVSTQLISICNKSVFSFREDVLPLINYRYIEYNETVLLDQIYVLTDLGRKC